MVGDGGGRASARMYQHTVNYMCKSRSRNGHVVMVKHLEYLS